jgi:hypothetical protein
MTTQVPILQFSMTHHDLWRMGGLEGGVVFKFNVGIYFRLGSRFRICHFISFSSIKRTAIYWHDGLIFGIMGHLKYLQPEQIRGLKNLDTASNISADTFLDQRNHWAISCPFFVVPGCTYSVVAKSTLNGRWPLTL